MIYIFQRLIQNQFQWQRPSPGRLGPHGEGDYVKMNGFGHEDWNFNKSLTINDFVYGYSYYRPAEKIMDEEFSIAFATYQSGRWFLAGFYEKCSFVENAPVNNTVIKQKANDILQLGQSLGRKYARMNNKALKTQLRHDQQFLNWKVKPNNIIVLAKPIEIPKKVFHSANYRIVRPTMLNAGQFNNLLKLGENYVLFDNEEEFEFPEGRDVEKLHKSKERNPGVRKMAIQIFLNKHGKLFCEVCNFDFEKKYGELGAGFIEAHHTIPLSELTAESITNTKDIALVCSNCHRMLHKRRPWLKINELKQILR